MAKIVAGSQKKSSSASSSKTVKSSAPSKSKLKAAKAIKAKDANKKKTAAKKTSRVSYKQEYIKLLQKTNRTLTKEIKGIKKAISQPEFKVERAPVEYEAFPKEPSVPFKTIQQPATKSIEQQILEQLQDIELQIRSRDIAFEDLVSGSAKLGQYVED